MLCWIPCCKVGLSREGVSAASTHISEQRAARNQQRAESPFCADCLRYTMTTLKHPKTHYEIRRTS